MNLDQIEDLLRRYLSAGIAVVVVLVSPLTGGTGAPDRSEVGATQTGQARAPDGQVDILDGTPPGARSGESPDTAPTDPEARTTEPGATEPDPVPDTPGPGAAEPDTSTDSDSDADADADAGDSGAGTDRDATEEDGAEQRSTEPGSTEPGSTEPGSTEPGAADLADRGPADLDEPGVSDDDAAPSEGAPDTGGAEDRPGSGNDGSGNDGQAGDEGTGGTDGTGGADATGPGPGPDSADRGTPPTRTPRPTDDPDADDPNADDPTGAAGTTDPSESTVPTTGAGPAEEDGSGSTEADGTPTTTAAPDTTAEGAAEPGAAAERYGWGTPVQSDDFTSTRLTGWTPYEGTGYDGQGRRSPDAISVRDGVLTITGDEEGTTGGLCWGGGQRYGRWEARLRAPASDVSYNALLLLWPDADDAPVGGEVDFVEMVDPARRSADFYLHFGEDDDQIRSRVEIDGTTWHDWAVEWTPERIVGYVDGEEWFSSTDPSTFPPGPMHLCIQLDWFPQGAGQVRESRMEVDRVAQYALDETAAAGGGGLLGRMLSWS